MGSSWGGEGAGGGLASIVSSPLLKTFLEIGFGEGIWFDNNGSGEVWGLGISKLMGPSSCSGCKSSDSLLLR